MAPLQILFIVGTIVWTLVALALSIRQSRHVGAHRDVVPPDFTASLSLDAHRKAADYTQAREALARWETIVDALVAIAWAAGGIALLYTVLATAIPLSLTRSVAFLVATGVVSTIVSLPFDVFRTFGLEQRFGFNRNSLGQFVIDRLKRAVLSLALAVPLLYALFFAMHNLTGLWWLWTWIGLIVLMMAAPSFYVRIVAPRFNRFEPLPEGELKSRIEALLSRCGFRSSGLFMMDASRRTAHGNAYFIGFGRTKRIVLFDTLAARCTPLEIEAVVAHELGHFLHHHVLFGLLRTAVMSFVVLAAFGWLIKQPWLLPAFGITASDDALALFVCLLLASIVGPLAAPISNWISRRNEYQADDHARRVVGVEPMVSALVGLARDNASTLTPDPLYSLVHHSHPPVPLRVRSLRRSEPNPA